MDSVNLGVINAISYSWHKHTDSFIVGRAVRAIAAGVQALFAKYTVTLHDARAVMRRHPDARFAEPVRRALARYTVSHLPQADRQSAATAQPLLTPQKARPRVPGQPPFTFPLSASETTLVKFISDNPPLSEVKTVYRNMRAAAGELWIKNAGLQCREVAVDRADQMVFGNKEHDVQSKYLIQIVHPLHRNYSLEEVLQVRDRCTGQLKLIRIGSFSEYADGTTTGGGGFPGYSTVSSTKAGVYLKNLVVKDQHGHDYQPYKDTRFGLGALDNNNIGSAWSCAFDALRMELYHATGYKFSFQVLVAFMEQMISCQKDADYMRSRLSKGHYPIGRQEMRLILSDIHASPAYPELLIEAGSDDAQNVTSTEINTGNRTRVFTRQQILDSTDWDHSSTAMLCQPKHAYGLYRNRKLNGRFEYIVYDPHNFSRRSDFYTAANGHGLKVFATAEQAIDFVTTKKGGHNDKLDGFYRIPDETLCALRDKMMKTKNQLEDDGTGF